MKLRKYIFESLDVNEVAYPHNIGFQEMIKFYKIANRSQEKEMKEIIEREDWEGFKELIRKTIGVKLK